MVIKISCVHTVWLSVIQKLYKHFFQFLWSPMSTSIAVCFHFFSLFSASDSSIKCIKTCNFLPIYWRTDTLIRSVACDCVSPGSCTVWHLLLSSVPGITILLSEMFKCCTFFETLQCVPSFKRDRMHKAIDSVICWPVIPVNPTKVTPCLQ